MTLALCAGRAAKLWHIKLKPAVGRTLEFLEGGDREPLGGRRVAAGRSLDVVSVSNQAGIEAVCYKFYTRYEFYTYRDLAERDLAGSSAEGPGSKGVNRRPGRRGQPS